MKKLLPVLFAFGLFSTACKKSQDAPPITKENLAGAYKIIADVATSSGVSTDVYATYQSCAKDDIWSFNTDNSLVVTDAGVVCDPSDSWSGTWSLEGTTITVAGQSGTVTKFDGSIMEITITLSDTSSEKITFKK
jgi:hypothetical protein